MRTQHLCVTACLKSKLSTVESVSVKYTACIYFFSTFTSSVFYLVLLQGKKKSLPRTGENKSLQWSGFFVTRQVKKWLQRDKDVRCRAGTKKTETDHLKRASMRSQTNPADGQICSHFRARGTMNHVGRARAWVCKKRAKFIIISARGGKNRGKNPDIPGRPWYFDSVLEFKIASFIVVIKVFSCYGRF